jgi:hypothetical protein
MDTKNKKPRKTEIAKCPTLVQVNYESKKRQVSERKWKKPFQVSARTEKIAKWVPLGQNITI